MADTRTKNLDGPGGLATKAESSRFKEVLAELYDGGRTPAQIAKQLEPHDPKARKATRTALWHMLERDPELHQMLAGRSKARMILALPTVTQALIQRAKRGRPDAIKLLFEASGFHNPKVQHEHSGDIQITLDIPRPARIEQAETEPAVDAEVVEE